MTCPTIGSTTANRRPVQITMVQPGPTAAASISGKTAAISAPIYGTKRRIIAKMPQSGALGTPMIQSPTPITAPKAALSASCVRNKPAEPAAASSIAAVVR